MSPGVIVAPEPITLEDRRRELTRRLDEINARTKLLDLEEQRIESEISEIAERVRPHRRLPMAKTVIASPCDVAWSSMVGDERTRFCGQCEKHVHNLEAMTTTEVETLLEQAKGTSTCVRLFERTDGTILTQDCPVGVKRRRTRSLLLATLGVGACALFGFTAIAIAISATLALREPQIVAVAGPTVTVTQRIEVPTPPTTVSVAAPLPTAPVGTGWVLVDGPQGAKVFEGNRLLGTTPLVLTMPSGSHSLRAEGKGADGKKWIETAAVAVPLHGRTAVTLHGPVVPVVPVVERHMMGDVSAPDDKTF